MVLLEATGTAAAASQGRLLSPCCPSGGMKPSVSCKMQPASLASLHGNWLACRCASTACLTSRLPCVQETCTRWRQIKVLLLITDPSPKLLLP